MGGTLGGDTAETDLLYENPIPAPIRSLCVELHPAQTGNEAISRMLVKLMQEGFALDFGVSRQNVVFLSR